MKCIKHCTIVAVKSPDLYSHMLAS